DRTDAGLPSKRRKDPQATEAEYASVDPIRLKAVDLLLRLHQPGEPAEAAREFLGPAGAQAVKGRRKVRRFSGAEKCTTSGSVTRSRKVRQRPRSAGFLPTASGSRRWEPF